MRLRNRRFAPRHTIPPSPPPEVLEAIAAAAEAYDRLEASGRQLHFSADEETGQLTVQLLDLERNLIGTVPVASVLDLASGTPLD